MKKIFGLIFILMCFVSINTFAAEESFGEVFANSTGVVYSDAKAAIDTVYHDGKAVVQTVYSDIKDGTSTIMPSVKDAVVSIGKSIGVAAEHVYNVLVKKYVVMGVKELMIFCGGLILLIVGLVIWLKKTSNNAPITYPLIAPALMFLIGIIMMINVNYDNMLMGLINPEYGAIDYILEYSKTIIK